MMERLTRGIHALLCRCHGEVWSLCFHFSENQVRPLVRATVVYAARQRGIAPEEIPPLAELVETALFLMIRNGRRIDPHRETGAVAAEYVQRALWVGRTVASRTPADRDAR